MSGANVTQMIDAISAGDAHAADELLPVVYRELRQLALSRMATEKAGQTLQPTALVHEAYLRLVAQPDSKWAGRGHFFAAAAEAMRRILIERARRRNAVKHGGGKQRIELENLEVADDQRAEQLMALDEALSELERHDANGARLVKLRYFAGFSHQEAAEMMGITRRAADRIWALARAWLYQRMSEQE